MRGMSLGFLIVACGCSFAQAQNPLDDIYNWREPTSTADPSAAKKWPPYYNPPPMPVEHQIKYAMGWCRYRSTLNFPVGMIYTIDPKDFIDVNKLPETSVTGKVVAAGQGQLLLQDEAKQPFSVIIHSDPSISEVAVGGKTLPEALKAGMYLRFSGKIDQQGQVSEVTDMELIGSAMQAQTPPIRIDERQMVVARVVSRKGDQLNLRIKSDSVPRLTVKLADGEPIGLRSSDYQLAAAGDDLLVKGKLYRPAGDPSSGNAIFATAVRIKLARPVANVAKGRRGRN